MAPGGMASRVLTNARCLSKGVDVPALDAVLFLSPRSSEVDVVQPVRRAMRTSPGKPCDHPGGHSRAQVARREPGWRGQSLSSRLAGPLRALRSHGERLPGEINKIGLNGGSRQIAVSARLDVSGRDEEDADPGDSWESAAFNRAEVGQWRRAEPEISTARKAN